MGADATVAGHGAAGVGATSNGVTYSAGGGAFSGAGAANTGNGGGSTVTGTGTAGGSGIVVLQFPASLTATVSAGLTSATTYAANGQKIVRITAGTGTVVIS